MELNIIVAHDKNNTIGNSITNNMPWHLPEDLKHFKKITMGYPMIMGKNTFLSFPKPLPGRKHIVITKSNELDIPNDVWEGEESEQQVISFSSLTKAIIYCENWKKYDKAFIIGGGQLYTSALKEHKIDKIYRTLIKAEFEGNIKFPKINEEKWELISNESHLGKNFTYNFQELKEK